jgi:hypothetical protein
LVLLSFMHEVQSLRTRDFGPKICRDVPSCVWPMKTTIRPEKIRRDGPD